MKGKEGEGKTCPIAELNYTYVVLPIMSCLVLVSSKGESEKREREKSVWGRKWGTM